MSLRRVTIKRERERDDYANFGRADSVFFVATSVLDSKCQQLHQFNWDVLKEDVNLKFLVN